MKTAPKTAVCPICAKSEADALYKPFCSRRCADVDLQRWFSGRYAIPVADDPGNPSAEAESDEA
jgi:endogenous inhibitor of DNA gyrase (YacG/DUF329 family)